MVNLNAGKKHVRIKKNMCIKIYLQKVTYFSKIYAVLNIGYRVYFRGTYTRFELKFTKCVFRFLAFSDFRFFGGEFFFFFWGVGGGEYFLIMLRLRGVL